MPPSSSTPASFQGNSLTVCKEVNDMTDQQVLDWFQSFDTVMTDCDGVLWVGKEAIEGSPHMIRRFRDLGKKVFFVTNNSSKHRREYKTKLDKLGFGGNMDEIIGTAYAAATYLEEVKFDKSKSVYVIGKSGIAEELDEVNIRHNEVEACPRSTLYLDPAEVLRGVSSLPNDVGAVVVGFTQELQYSHLVLASLHAMDPNVLLLNTDPGTTIVRRDESGKELLLPGCGSIMSSIEAAAGRSSTTLGKPSKFMFQIVQKKYPGVQASRTLMIGDRGDTDIALGKNCGLKTLLVGSGVHSLEETRRWETSDSIKERRQAADYYVDKLGDLLARVETIACKQCSSLSCEYRGPACMHEKYRLNAKTSSHRCDACWISNQKSIACKA